jgi:two-component system cell cycle response regulator
MNKNIYIYETDKDALSFLKSFFRKRDYYSARFFSGLKPLKAALREGGAHALIAGSPHNIDEIKPSDEKYPIIAVVSKDITKGLRSVVKYDVECYLLSPFHAEDLDFKLKTVCEQKRSWFEALYRDKKDLEAIVELTYLVSSTLDPKEVLYFVVKRISEIIKVTRCSILSLGIEEKKYAVVSSSYEDPKIKDLRLDLNKYPEIRKALKTKKAVIVKDAMKDPLMSSVKHIIKPIGIKSIVVLPVVFRDEVIGTLFLRTSRAGHVFTDREIKLCSAIANACSNALYNAFLYEKVRTEKEKLEKLAITDYLTGIYNIRYLYHRLGEEFSRSQRYETPISCIMFDIDHFKKINDTYGHRVGDIVLREFAQLVKKSVRKSDVFARYGGEEFILLLPHTAKKGALFEGERLADNIKKYSFKSLKAGAQVTVSMGIATFPHKKIKTQDDLITYADNALFEAKAKGRNKVVIFK